MLLVIADALTPARLCPTATQPERTDFSTAPGSFGNAGRTFHEESPFVSYMERSCMVLLFFGECFECFAIFELPYFDHRCEPQQPQPFVTQIQLWRMLWYYLDRDHDDIISQEAPKGERAMSLFSVKLLDLSVGSWGAVMGQHKKLSPKLISVTFSSLKSLFSDTSRSSGPGCSALSRI